MAKGYPLPNTGDSRILQIVDMRPRWSEDGERPVHVCNYPEGDLKWYGTGTVVAEVKELPITVRMPFALLRGQVVWVTSRARRQEMNAMLRKVVSPSGIDRAERPRHHGPRYLAPICWST